MNAPRRGERAFWAGRLGPGSKGGALGFQRSHHSHHGRKPGSRRFTVVRPGRCSHRGSRKFRPKRIRQGSWPRRDAAAPGGVQGDGRAGARRREEKMQQPKGARTFGQNRIRQSSWPRRDAGYGARRRAEKMWPARRVYKIGLRLTITPKFPPLRGPKGALRARAATRRETGLSTQAPGGETSVSSGKNCPPTNY